MAENGLGLFKALYGNLTGRVNGNIVRISGLEAKG
jgi:hypothetical protein